MEERSYKERKERKGLPVPHMKRVGFDHTIWKEWVLTIQYGLSLLTHARLGFAHSTNVQITKEKYRTPENKRTVMLQRCAWCQKIVREKKESHLFRRCKKPDVCYAMMCTRPDIDQVQARKQFSVLIRFKQGSSFQTNPGPAHWKIVGL